MIEKLVKRTIFKAVCPSCKWEDIILENPPLERLCGGCSKVWCKYESVEWVGPDRFDQ